MPHPLLHVGVNGFFGLLLRRWVDPFVIVAVNVIIDLEVLFAPGFPDYHRHWYFHTFLVGATKTLTHDNTIRQATDMVVPGLQRR